jgi:hypothetical protein
MAEKTIEKSEKKAEKARNFNNALIVGCAIFNVIALSVAFFIAQHKIDFSNQDASAYPNRILFFWLIIFTAILTSVTLVYWIIFFSKQIKNTSNIRSLINEFQQKIDYLNQKEINMSSNSLEQKLKKEFERLDGIILAAEEHRNNLLHHFVITWKESSDWELDAEEVWSITPNLIWTLAFRKEKIFDACKYRNHKYKYLIRGNSLKAQNCLDKINEDIPSILAKYVLSNLELFKDSQGKIDIALIHKLLEDLSANFQVKRLSEIDLFRKMNCPAELPIPGDLVLYKNMPRYNAEKKEKYTKTVAVISLFAIEKYDHYLKSNGDLNISDIDKKHKYDVQIEDETVFEDFQVWFKRIWDEIPETTNLISINKEKFIDELEQLNIKVN